MLYCTVNVIRRGFAASLDFLAQTLDPNSMQQIQGLRKPCPRLALFARMYCFLHPWFCLCKLADCFPAKVAVCRSWFAFVQSTIPYVGSWNQGAMPSHGTRIRMLATRNDTAPLSLRRPNKGAEKACAYARLLRETKHATWHRFVCAI